MTKLVAAIFLISSLSFAKSPEREPSAANKETAKQAAAGYIDPRDAKDISSVRVVYTKPNCNHFINDDGEVGSYGKQVIKSIEKYPAAYFKSMPRDFAKQSRGICPNFNKMSASQKRLFWVWMFRSLGHTESSCRAAPPVTIKKDDTKNKNPADYADRGMFQLNYARCGHVDLNNALVNIDCIAKLLAKEINKRGKLTSSETSGEATYWGPLRTDSGNQNRSKGSIRNSKRTQDTIGRFKYCDAMPSREDEEREGDQDDDEMTVEIVEAKTKVLYTPSVEPGKVIPTKTVLEKVKTKLVPKEKKKK